MSPDSTALYHISRSGLTLLTPGIGYQNCFNYLLSVSSNIEGNRDSTHRATAPIAIIIAIIIARQSVMESTDTGRP